MYNVIKYYLMYFNEGKSEKLRFNNPQVGVSAYKSKPSSRGN